jgi:hypothetical protein
MATQNEPAGLPGNLSHLPGAVSAPLVASPKTIAALLDDWMKEDSDYDLKAWPEIKASLDRDRTSARTVFDR